MRIYPKPVLTRPALPLVTAERYAAKTQILVARPLWLLNIAGNCLFGASEKMKQLLWLTAITVLVAALFVSYPLLTIWRLGTAVRQSDDLAVDAMVDWPQVKDGLKSQFFSTSVLPELQKSGSTAETVGGMLGLTLGSSVLDRLLDGMATGRTLVALYKKNPESASINIDWIREVRFLSLTQFHFALQNPNERTNPIKFVMSLEGVEWKVTRIQFSDPAATIADLKSRTKDDPQTPTTGDGLQ